MEHQGNVTVLSPVTHTDVWREEEEQKEDWGENMGAKKVKETTSDRKLTQRIRLGDRAQQKGWRISAIQEEDRENKALKGKPQMKCHQDFTLLKLIKALKVLLIATYFLGT